MDIGAAQILSPRARVYLPMAAYLQGIPFDLVHALATIVFLAVISRPMLEKLDRIKVKYGLVEAVGAPAKQAKLGSS